MGKLISINIVALIIGIVLLPNANAEEWPGQKGGLGAPVNLYGVGKSCGDFIRAKKEYKDNKPEGYLIYFYWASGYITALNSELPKGGNVLGHASAKITDFMIMVSSYCTENPLEPFINGVSVPLKQLKPVDWQNHEYR